MSLLADLLSKKTNDIGNREVSPTLSRSHARGKTGKVSGIRYLVISAFGIAAIVIGCAAVYYVGSIRKAPPLSTARPLSQPVAVQPGQTGRDTQPPQTAAGSAPAPVGATSPTVASGQTPALREPAVAAQSPAAGKPALPAAESTFKAAANTSPPATGVGNRSKPVIKRRFPAGKTARITAKAAVSSAQKRAGVSPAPDTVRISAPAVVSAPEQKRDPATRDARIMAAQASESDRDYPAALSHYRAALENDPDNYRIMNNMAGLLLKSGSAGQALDTAKMALSRKPDYIPALMNAGIASSRSGNNDDAVKYMNIAANLHPENRGARLNLGIMQEKTGKHEDALATYRKLAGEGDTLGMQGVARIYERQGRQTEAVAVYKQILTVQDISPSLHREVRECLNRLNSH